MEQQTQLQQQVYEELASFIAHTDGLKTKKYLLNPALNIEDDVTAYIEQVQRFNQSIKSKSLPYSFMQEIRTKLCNAARDYCITLHRSNHKDALARNVTSILQKEFNDIPTLKYQLEQDYNALSKNIRASDPFPSEEKRREREIDHHIKSAIWARVIIPGSLFLILMGIIFITRCSSKMSEPVVFSQSVDSGDSVYCYIRSIQPTYTITDENNYTTDVICKCVTQDNFIIWVYMSTHEYRTDFDANADFANISKTFDEMCFTSSKYIEGEAIRAGEISSSLMGKTADILFDYTSSDRWK